MSGRDRGHGRSLLDAHLSAEERDAARRARAPRARALRAAGDAGRGRPGTRSNSTAICRRARRGRPARPPLHARRRRLAPGRLGDRAVPDPRGPGARLDRGRDRLRAAGPRQRSRCCSSGTRRWSTSGSRASPRRGGRPASRCRSPRPAATSPRCRCKADAVDGDGWRPERRKDLDLQRARSRPLHGLRPHHRGRRRARPDRASRCRARAEGLTGEPIEMLSPHPIGRLVFDGRPRAGRGTCSARSTAASPWRCGRSTCSVRASAPSPSAWPRRRSTRPSRTPPSARPSAAS